MRQISIARLEDDDLTALEAALVNASLPTADLIDSGAAFYRCEDGVGIVGFGGLEGDGDDRLLRSIVVPPLRRGEGLGQKLVGLLEDEARSAGARRLHVLTTTAATFFKANGYVDAERSSAPASVSASREFSGLCPASAIYLVKAL